MATTISTDKSRQLNWVIRQATDQSINLQFNNIGGGGFDLSSYVLRLDVLSHEGQTLLSLTQGSGITNGGPSGLVTISINKTKSNIVEGRHWYKLYNTSPSDYVIITGVFQVNAGVFDDSFSNNQSLLVSLGTTQVNVDVTLIGGGGSGGGVTNLSYTASPTQGTVVSDTGDDATIPAGNTTNASLMLPGDKTKLDGIQSNATANSTDAQLRDRATHTGTQTASTISDFANTVRTTVLTGLSLITGGVISATDSILVGFGKLQNQITALGSSKQDALVSGTNIKTLEGQSLLGSGNIDLSKSDVGLANVDNTSDANKPISTATQTALNGKENTITAGTTSQYFRGDKTFQTLNKAAVGLSNVDNTSDLNKPISTATQTALDGKQKVITSGTAAPSGGVDGDIYLQFT